jgi:RHS repeat-associated protein
VSGIEYKGAALEAIYTSEGRCTPNGATAFFYEYTIKDHLGNARVSFRANGAAVAVIQENHYYAFGMEMEGAWATQSVVKNNYEYNGKELNEDFGLNLSDYGARWYDAAIGRWWSVDPLAEQFASKTSYNYGLNNPIIMIDPDGMTSEAAGPSTSSEDMVEKLKGQAEAGKTKEIEAKIKGLQKNEDKDPVVQMLNNVVGDIDKQMNQMWKNSFPNGDNSKVEEWGGSVVKNAKNKNKIVNSRTDHAGGTVDIKGKIGKGFTKIGDVHTHPYSSSEGGNYNAAFSPADISRLSDFGQGTFSLVEAGDRRFALVVLDKAKADAFFSTHSLTDIESIYKKSREKDALNGVSFAQQCSNAVRAVIGNDNGIGFYRTDNTEKTSFIRTNN